QEPVDYLKIDVEFSEWAVLEEAMEDQGTLGYIKQLGVEVRSPSVFFDPSADPRRTFVHMFEALHRLEILGFRKFNYRKNPFGSYKSNITGLERSCCYELHYINSHFLSDNFTVVHTKDSKIFH
ncbi:hypothetical protein EGW08_010233, partial [Elysia chlorotica]